MKLKDFYKSAAFKDFAIIFVLLGIITILFNVTRLDLTLQSFFYNSSEGWFLKFKPFWDYFYRYGVFPGYFFGLAGLVMIAVSYWNTSYVKYRRAALMLVYTLVLGPGLIINMGLKDHWGRPRPFEVQEFGGKQQFLCVCALGESDGGKSFPCGHCSMGFFLAVPYLIFRRRNRRLAYAFLISGIIYGLLIGLSRMIAGGHFASDVLWSGGLVWLTALTGTYLFKIDKPIVSGELSKANQKTKARLATLIVSVVLLVITVGLMIATPYISQKTISISTDILKRDKTSTLIADFKDAMVDISPDSVLNIGYKVNAFGFPNSKIRGKITKGDTIKYQIQWMGMFTEVRNSIHVGFPAALKMNYILNVKNGKVYFNLPDSSQSNFNFTLGKGEIHLSVKDSGYYFSGDSNSVVNTTGKTVHWFNPVVKQKSEKFIKFNIGKGRLFIE